MQAFDSKPLYIGLYNTRWAPNFEEFTLEMSVEVERLRLEILFSQPPPPPQYDISPGRSHAAGTGLNEPGVPHTVTQQTEQEETFPQSGVDGFCVLTLQ